MSTRIMIKICSTRTSGAPLESPARLISGTAVPCLTPEMNTVARYDPTIFFHLASTTSPKRRGSRRAKRLSDNRANFAMMPAYAVRRDSGFNGPALPQAVNTSLAAKAGEEMSEFERDYPW